MTACNAFVFPDYAQIVTDGAACDPSARLVHLMHKVTPLPHAGCAVAFRGARVVGSMVIDAVSAMALSYDQLRRDIHLLRGQTDAVAPVWRKKFGKDFMNCEMLVAGWSETRGAAAFVIGTSDTNSTFGLKAWNVLDIGGAFLSPSDERLAHDFGGAEFTDAAAVDLVRRQRSITPRPGVGGFVQSTIIRQHSIETRILERWPDRVGETIGNLEQCNVF